MHRVNVIRMHPHWDLMLCWRLWIFTTKIQSTARALGYHLEVIGDVFKAKSAILARHPQVIFVDLTAGKLSAPESLCELDQACRS